MGFRLSLAVFITKHRLDDYIHSILSNKPPCDAQNLC